MGWLQPKNTTLCSRNAQVMKTPDAEEGSTRKDSCRDEHAREPVRPAPHSCRSA